MASSKKTSRKGKTNATGAGKAKPGIQPKAAAAKRVTKTSVTKKAVVKKDAKRALPAKVVVADRKQSTERGKSAAPAIRRDKVAKKAAHAPVPKESPVKPIKTSSPRGRDRTSAKLAPLPMPGARHSVVQPSPSRKKDNKGVTPADCDKLRIHLLDMRERLKHQVDVLKGESLQRSEEIVTEEDGTFVFDRQFALTLASSEQDAIYDIDDALRRLDDGTYGTCEECNCIVETARLRALPFVRLCISCQSARERTRPRFRPME